MTPTSCSPDAQGEDACEVLGQPGGTQERRLIMGADGTTGELLGGALEPAERGEFWLAGRRDLATAQRSLWRAWMGLGRPDHQVIDGSQSNVIDRPWLPGTFEDQLIVFVDTDRLKSRCHETVI
ncbi:hypothetical protein NKI98_29100 [Mesorhizobium sp. M0222]|uniref:hypothetical protein n=1 Tax=Mesorhizobium sp. M0222 TaxID=2956921 RepID=UPI00333575E3